MIGAPPQSARGGKKVKLKNHNSETEMGFMFSLFLRSTQDLSCHPNGTFCILGMSLLATPVVASLSKKSHSEIGTDDPLGHNALTV